MGKPGWYTQRSHPFQGLDIGQEQRVPPHAGACSPSLHVLPLRAVLWESCLWSRSMRWRCHGALRALRLLFVSQELQMGHPEWLVAQWHEAGYDLLTL